MKKVWKFILANLDTLIAILISLLAAIMGAFGENQLLLLAGISATLTVIAVGLIRDRANRESLAEQIAELKRCLPNHTLASEFFNPKYDATPHFQDAKQIDLCGVTLTNTMNKNFTVFRELLEAGTSLREMIIDPTPPSVALEMSAQRSDNPKDTAYYQRRWESAISDLLYLHQYVEKLRLDKKPSKIGTLSVRLLPYAPSIQIISLDTRKKNGSLYIEIYPSKMATKMTPIFEVTNADDKKWYDFFVDQYEQMWKTATPWDPASLLPKVVSQ
jgi:hypothetical protein